MTKTFEKHIFELNILGSYLIEDDSYRSFERAYLKDLLSENKKFEVRHKIDYDVLEEKLTQSIIPFTKNRTPVVFLSGGIDSTVIAHILYKNNVKFRACSFFNSIDDPAIENIEYLESKFEISSAKIFLDYSKIRDLYNHYFLEYDSPNMDYAFLTMNQLIKDFYNHVEATDKLVFFDGIEGDNLFGYSNNFKLKLKSNILNIGSGEILNNRIMSFRKGNIYSSSILNDYSLNSIIQNFIFPKILNQTGILKLREHINDIALKMNRTDMSFYSKNMIGMLYYMGRRVAYKSYLPIRRRNSDIVYPYINDQVLQFGFELNNKLKIHPFIKAPLKKYLEREGYNERFIHAPKKGMGLDIFKVIDFEEVVKSIDTLYQVLDLKNKENCSNYLYSIFKRRDKAADHFLFGLVMSAKYINHND